MDLARGERCEGVKKESCIKKQDTQPNFCIANMIIAGDLKSQYTMETCRGILNFWQGV